MAPMAAVAVAVAAGHRKDFFPSLLLRVKASRLSLHASLLSPFLI